MCPSLSRQQIQSWVTATKLHPLKSTLDFIPKSVEAYIFKWKATKKSLLLLDRDETKKTFLRRAPALKIVDFKKYKNLFRYRVFESYRVNLKICRVV